MPPRSRKTDAGRAAIYPTPMVDAGVPALDLHDLLRFVFAQAPIYDHALAELRAGQKRSHWTWFVFPQLKGLGSSPMALRYGISSLEEARAYLAQPLLGPRLVACTQAVSRHTGQSLHSIFGSPDDVKFCSSMTLFAHATDNDESVFLQALAGFCGTEDKRTITMLRNRTRGGSPGRPLQ